MKYRRRTEFFSSSRSVSSIKMVSYTIQQRVQIVELIHDSVHQSSLKSFSRKLREFYDLNNLLSESNFKRSNLVVAFLYKIILINCVLVLLKTMKYPLEDVHKKLKLVDSQHGLLYKRIQLQRYIKFE